jgi:adenylate kinase
VRVAIMGAPGAGKGTQARLLAQRTGTPHVSTGDILRQAGAAGTKLGREASTYMDKGQLVPDQVVVGIVAERLQGPDCAQGFILDGFPRTVAQAKALVALGQRLTAVVELAVPREELVQRLTGRRVCRSCGTMFHVTFTPPQKPGHCDRCGGELFQREDDLEQTIRHRMDVYSAQTAPVLGYYRDAGLLREVSGTGGPDEVFGRVVASLS